MNVNSTTTLELNALYGEMTSNITQIKNIDLLKKSRDEEAEELKAEFEDEDIFTE